jgi:hypothetical protein
LNGLVALGRVTFFVATGVIVGGGALVYVGLGAAWFLGPLVLFSCPLDIHSVIVEHTGGGSPVGAFLKWPLDALRVAQEAERRHVPTNQVRLEE